jgi:dipeptidase
VSELRPGAALHWVTASAAPCLSLFKPVLFEAGLPDQGPRPTDRFDSDARWWRHERLHRKVLTDYAPLAALGRDDRDTLECAFAARMEEALAADGGPAALRAAVDACWREADAAEDRWLAQVVGSAPRRGGKGAHGRSWSRHNQVAGLP